MNQFYFFIGHYSIKIFATSMPKKKAISTYFEEMPLEDFSSFETNFLEKLSDKEKEQAHISSFKNKIFITYALEKIFPFVESLGEEDEYNVIFPNELSSFRFLSIPILNEKKAEQIIPFELEESIPIPLTSAHLSSYLFKEKNSFDAICAITEKKEMEVLHSLFKNFKRPPRFISVEAHFLSRFFRKDNEITSFDENFLLLDLGHFSTKGLFFSKGKLELIQSLNQGGLDLDYLLEKHFQISLSEAKNIKETKAFIVTEGHLNELPDQSQKEFAKLMISFFTPMAIQIKRWIIGHRAKANHGITKIYLCGQMAHLKNLGTFLQSEIGIKVLPYPVLKDSSLENNEEKITRGSLAHPLFDGALKYGIKSKLPKIKNFFHGEFSLQSLSSLSPFSTSFVSIRVAIVSFIIFIGLGIQRYVLDTKIIHVDNKLKKLLDDPSLNLSRGEKNSYKKTPDKIFSLLLKRNTTKKEELDNLQLKAGTDALGGLFKLSHLISYNKNITLNHLKSYPQSHEFVLVSDKIDDLKILESHLKNAQLPSLEIRLDESKKELAGRFGEISYE